MTPSPSRRAPTGTAAGSTRPRKMSSSATAPCYAGISSSPSAASFPEASATCLCMTANSSMPTRTSRKIYYSSRPTFGGGGFVENIFVENITAKSTQFGVLGIDTDVLYEWRDLVPTYEEKLTAIRDIHVKNVTVEETGSTPFKIVGDARLPVKDIFLENITIRKATGQAKSCTNAENIHESGVRIVELVADKKEGK